MTAEQQIQAWRALSPAQRLDRYRRALPTHIAKSMAMEGEPVPIEIIRLQLERHITQHDLSRPHSET